MLEIGARTVLRECVTVQPGTSGEGSGRTVVGSDCLIMAYAHVAHDCVIGDKVIIANATQIAGHCVVEDGAILGGVTTVHQFVRVGTRAITGASTRLQLDVPPFMLADGHPAKLYGLNVVGLKRAKLAAASMSELKRAYRMIFVRGPYSAMLDEVERTMKGTPEVARLCAFLRSSKRGVTRGRSKRATGLPASEE